MAGYIILRRLLKERDQPLRKERVFRDRSQALDTLNDQELISRYRFPSHVIWRLVDLVKQDIEPKTYRSHAIPAHIQVNKLFVLIGSSLVFINDGTIHRQLGVQVFRHIGHFDLGLFDPAVLCSSCKQ